MALIKCCFCNAEIEERFSNNAEPVKNGRCCDKCNWEIVIVERLRRV